MKIIIVDDSAVIRERLVDLVSGVKGAEIIDEVEDVLEAVKSITKKKPGIVILDLKLRGGNGIDVLKKIKEQKLNPVVIVLSNYPYPEFRDACFKAGADFFFDKACDFGNLLRTLKVLGHEE